MVPCMHQGNIITKTKLQVWRDQKCRSVAEQPDNFNLFAREVLNLVRRWEFAFDESDSGACARSQQLVTQFQFTYGN